VGFLRWMRKSITLPNVSKKVFSSSSSRSVGRITHEYLAVVRVVEEVACKWSWPASCFLPISHGSRWLRWCRSLRGWLRAHCWWGRCLYTGGRLGRCGLVFRLAFGLAGNRRHLRCLLTTCQLCPRTGLSVHLCSSK
jgi:hypothetical protein